MTSPSVCTNQHNDIQKALLNGLEERRQQYPGKFSKAVHVLATVNDSVGGQWKERLKEAKDDHTGERVVLIPYKSDDCHWIGVLLEFKANGEIKRAEFIDPVEQSQFVPDKLQKQFAEIYSNVILRSRNLQKHDDQKQSAALTVENLLNALETQLKTVSTSVPSEGNQSKLRDLELTVNCEQERERVQDVPKLSEKIRDPEQRIEKSEETERIEEVRNEKDVLTELLQQQASVEETIFPGKPSEEATKTDSEEEEYSITRESVRNMHDDFDPMPPCLERSVIYLLHYVLLKLMSNTMLSQYSIKVPDQIEMEKELECLTERLEIEEIESSEIHHSIKVASANIKNRNWKCAMTVLRQLLKQIQPLNMHELHRLVRKNNDAALLMEGKEIILFLGRTGSGKSTAIHFLYGSKMVEVEVKGYNHIAPIEINNSDLEKITTSPLARSETRYMHLVQVDYNDVETCTNGSAFLCDTPGFEDTGGPEVDIANGIGIVRAIKRCKSVKPVVFLSYKRIGDRCEGVKELAHMLTGLIPGVKDHLKAFSYVFTKFPDRERKVIHTSLKDVNDTLTEEEKLDTRFTDILKDMIKKTRNGARVLYPLKDRPVEILDEFANSVSIHHPEEVFQFFITEKSKAVVQQQIRQNQLSIISATNRSDYLLVKYRLDQLKSLNDLLHQDHIEQVYIECVRCVNKHLSKEYQTGISMLDHCLTNQTILNIEDIQRYQTCIDHFQLAEELRNSHLGKEVVHSSAFILYLNQQIKAMCIDFKEKDIDDSSVKMSLDKLKLISNVFSDIVASYQNMWQLFAEKFDSEIRSFKSSVLSNKFDQSAISITKLHGALNVLQDHLDSENMQMKYVELTKYFLDYLSDAVRKLDDILIKENLEKSDINSLDSCLCMLIFAHDTSALQPHISKESISEIYENLLTRILNYVKNIIRDIDIQFENRNSFDICERKIEQLTLVRAISVISDRTSESYWKTLEKLVGYIHESGRIVEDQLRILFRREEKVDHEKLKKCLSSLKGAKWIEKYRSGVYSNVMNDVEHQFIQHVKTLTESVLEVDLGLDHFDKIEQVHKTVSDINEMESTARIVTDIKELVDAVNDWFKRVINNVIVIIKDTFSLEKWRKSGYQTLDYNKAEKAFHFLDACRKTRVVFDNDCTSVLNSLEEFGRELGVFIQRDMEHCFEKIIHYENNSKEDIFEKARVLFNRLQDISEIKTKYPRVFSCFLNQKMTEYWRSELSNYLIEMSDEMRKLSATRQTAVLNIKLVVVKALRKLDSFLDNGKYALIYNEYQDVLYSQIKDVSQQIKDGLIKYDYEQVAREMVALQATNDVGQHFFKQAQQALNASVENLMEETKAHFIMLGNNIEIEGIRSVVENLRRLQKAKQCVSQFMSLSDEIDQCIEEVKKSIGDRVHHFLKGVKALITINDFSEADKKIESIILVRTLLGNYCTDDVFREIELLKERQDDVVSKELVSKYSAMDISGYTFNPPKDIFAKLREVNNTNPIYNQASNTLRESILERFRKELDEARSERPPNPENSHIRKCESAVKYLPDDMKNALEVQLGHCRGDITSLIQDNNNKFQNAFDSRDLQTIKTILLDYQNSRGMQAYIDKGRDLVLKQMQEIILKINENLERYEIIEALNNVKKLYDYKLELETVLIEIRRPYAEVRSAIKKKFHDAYSYFTNRFLNAKISVVSDETIEIVERSFICLIEFMKFGNEEKDQPIFIDVLPDDFDEKILALNKRTLQYFNDHQKKYKDAIEELDVTFLKDSFKSVNQWNCLFMKMRNYDHLHNINDPYVNTMVRAMTEVASCRQMSDDISQRIEKLGNELIHLKLINIETREHHKQRNEFYRNLNEKFSILNKAKLFDVSHISIDIHKIEQECLQSLEEEIKEICSQAENFVERFSKDIRLTSQECDDFKIYYNNLLSFKQEMKIVHFEINENMKKLEDRIFNKIQQWEKSVDSEPKLEDIANNLIHMKRASNNILPFKVKINEKIDEIIQHYKRVTKGSTAFGKLSEILNKDSNGIGQSIIFDHKAFQGFRLSVMNEKTRKHGIDYVLSNLQGDSLDKILLKKRYDDFHSIYERLLAQHLKPYIELRDLISDTKLIAGNIKQQTNEIDWDADIRHRIPKLAAHIFAIWTLQNADHYFEAVNVEDKNNYLLKPHAAQIISVFRMLGIGDSEEQLKNNLVQIRTGEGKSITLGATAAILALLGFDVRCACYSEYLSQRDYAALRSLFDSLDLLDYIHYGTFNKLCEDMINENGDIRQTVEQLISKHSISTSRTSQPIKRAKILLVDEVDVFFSRDFYGNVYTPSAILRDPTITSLINFIWKERYSKLNLNRVKLTDEYEACCVQYPNWTALIEETVKDMLLDVTNFESHDYDVEHDKIRYIEQDNIVYNVFYGYKTLFAYYCEHEKGNISKESLEENIGMRIKCGSFSYAEIPLDFQYIIGVTGTLETLSEPEKGVIEVVYKILKKTYIPSVFGKNNLWFIERDDIVIENSDDYFNRLRKEIDDRLIGKSLGKRAVLVFFESKQKLKEFYDSAALDSIKELVSCLTEEASSEDKENLIKRATTSGQITLLTKNFGRGTDFICHDQSVATNGGTHVIQTFLSEEWSEEVQIKGRTARQGDRGSYNMVLLDRDLEKFHIENDDIEDVKKGRRLFTRITNAFQNKEVCKTIYELLHDRRAQLFKNQYDANTKYIEHAKEKHLAARAFLLNLYSEDIASVREFLIKENQGVGGVCISRTVCLMDATSSMSHLLHKCKNTVDVMFERASETLKDDHISPDSFQIQLVVYRNYNCPEGQLLQSSPWETRPDNLRTFMNTIEAKGGWGNEAIEIGLWHANQENEKEGITQVILIGDAPPNTEEGVIEKRKDRGEIYWAKTKFAQSTYYENELEKLISSGIPVNAFFVEQQAKESFAEIAKRTGGQCQMLDVNSLAGSKMLTDLVTEAILKNVGGSSKGDALVAAYRKKFGKSYTQ